ncbi:MAG: helix-turn-helix domain-containing protein [Cyclobacteriaceae bacterium]
MQFTPHQLTSPTDRFLESIFHFKDFMPDHAIERVVPTGHIFIIFELDDFPRNTFDNQTLKPNASFSKVWVTGMHRNYISISAHQKSEMLVIQFKAYGAYPFVHFPIEQLNEKVVPAEEVFGQDILALRETIVALETPAEKFESAEKWLCNRFDISKEPPEDLPAVLEQLKSQPAANYNQVVASFPHTKKHLIDQCKKYMGLTPKYYQRILRFNEILQQIQKKEKITWAQIAYQCGYADQSHFIKEFKHFSGFNPSEFIQQYSDDQPNFFPLDRKG